MPHLTAIMIALAVPPALVKALRPARVAVFLIGLCFQAGFSSVVYGRWMFGAGHGEDVGHASPPYLLSTVGWPLLANLYAALHLERKWGLHLASYLFGAGAVFYGLAFISIMQNLHNLKGLAGQAALFLIIAPPSVMSVRFRAALKRHASSARVEERPGARASRDANTRSRLSRRMPPQATLAGFDGGFRGPSQALFGFCLVMLTVLIRLGPKLAGRPDTLGTYWAYVFPPAALATAAIGNAVAEESRAARGLAWFCVALATLALGSVFCRTTWQNIKCLRGLDAWDDALLFKAHAEDRRARGDAEDPAVSGTP